MLPSAYRESRDIEQVKKTWDPILRHVMGRHWEMIREGMEGFSTAHDDVLKAVAKYEREETAELICREFLDNVFPGALDVLAQLGPVVNRYPNYFTDTSVDMAVDNSDARSTTMGPEPSSSSRPGQTTSMGPPPRPYPLMIPEFGPATRGEGSGKAGSPAVCDTITDSPPPEETDHGPLTLQQSRKRNRDTTTTGTETPQTGEPATNKRTRKANATQRTIALSVVEGFEYIFKDKRCGPGHYVIRCDVGDYPRLDHPGVFVTPPLEDDTALDHFNGRGHDCHDTTRRYSIDDIIHEFAHRVTRPDSGLVTVKMVNESNEKLRRYQEHDATGARYAKMSPKGKEVASGTSAQIVANLSSRVGADSDDEDCELWDEVRARFTCYALGRQKSMCSFADLWTCWNSEEDPGGYSKLPGWL